MEEKEREREAREGTPRAIPAVRKRWLVHDAGLDDVGRRSHRGSDKPAAHAAESVRDRVVADAGVRQDRLFGRVVGGQLSQVDQRRPLHVRHPAPPQALDAALAQRRHKGVRGAVVLGRKSLRHALAVLRDL